MPHSRLLFGGVTEIPDGQKVAEFKYLAELIGFIDNVYIPTVQIVAEAYSDWFDIGRGCMNMLA